jgi:type IV secretion system protein TrbL
VNGGPAVQGQTGLAPNLGGSIGDQIMWAISVFLCWVGMGIMFLMRIAQQVLYLIEIGVCPFLLSLAMIPGTAHIAGRFIMGLVAIVLWPLGCAICNLVTMGLLDLGINSSSNPALSVANAFGMFSPLGGLGYLIVLSLWVIGSTFAAPFVIGRMLGVGGAGSAAVAAVFGATVGAAAGKAAAGASAAVGGVPGVAMAGANMFPSTVSVQAGARMNGMRPNYAGRPVTSQKEEGA